MKEQCMICGSVVEDVSGICPVCGSVLGRSTQMPYNYQNPNMGAPGIYSGAGKKKIVFSVLSIVLAVFGLFFMCCVPWLGILFSIAAIVLGIIALVKKHIKVPAILGLVFGGIAVLISLIALVMNLLMQVAVGTSIPGVLKECMVSMEEGPNELEDIVVTVPSVAWENTYALATDGRYTEVNSGETGTYQCYGYMDNSVQKYMSEAVKNQMTEYVVFAMSEGYEVREVTILELTDSTGDEEYVVFIVPEGFQPGDSIYYMEGTSASTMQMKEVMTFENYYD